MERMIRWLTADPIHAALTIGFGSAIASGVLELLQQAMARSAPPYALASIAVFGVAATSQASRCARLLIWLSINQVDRRS